MSTSWQDPDAIALMLDDLETWAVVGLSDNPSRTAWSIAQLLQSRGKRIVPIHPAAEVVHGEQGYASLADVPFPIDVVDVFRRSEDAGEFGAAWGGISSLQVGLPAVWTEARLRGHSLLDVVRWMSQRPAEIARLQHKGRIERGYHADFAVFAPDDAFVVDPKRLHHRNPVTPYAQRALAGVVRSTWLRGARVTGNDARGQLISRGEA